MIHSENKIRVKKFSFFFIEQIVIIRSFWQFFALKGVFFLQFWLIFYVAQEKLSVIRITVRIMPKITVIRLNYSLTEQTPLLRTYTVPILYES
jgi:hypothetical protein